MNLFTDVVEAFLLLLLFVFIAIILLLFVNEMDATVPLAWAGSLLCALLIKHFRPDVFSL